MAVEPTCWAPMAGAAAVAGHFVAVDARFGIAPMKPLTLHDGLFHGPGNHRLDGAQALKSIRRSGFGPN